MDTAAQPNPTEKKPEGTNNPESVSIPSSPLDISSPAGEAAPSTTPTTASSSPSFPSFTSSPLSSDEASKNGHGHIAYYLLALSLLLIGFVLGYFTKTAILPNYQNIPVPSPTQVMQRATPTMSPMQMQQNQATPSGALPSTSLTPVVKSATTTPTIIPTKSN